MNAIYESLVGNHYIARLLEAIPHPWAQDAAIVARATSSGKPREDNEEDSQ